MRESSMHRIILLALPCLVLASCGRSPKDLTLGEWDRLDKSERETMMRELGEEEGRLLMMGALRIGMSGDTVGVRSMTVGDVIERGRSVNRRESTSQ
jgi:hypothetical protein